MPLLASCEKELEFEYHDIEPQMVIEATLTQDGAKAVITETTPMDESMNRTPITDAEIALTDLTDGSVCLLTAGADGSFTDPTPGKTGHDYSLTVTRAGKIYTSGCRMREAVPVPELEFSWIKMPYDDVALLQVTFSDPAGAGDCYWVRLLRNGEAYSWSLTDDRAAENGKISEVLVTSRRDTGEEDDDKVLVDGDVMTAIVTPVSRDMMDYLMALTQDSNGPAMFEGDFCLGYFLASGTSEASITFHPDDIEYFE